jgi:hypothetical protein
VRPAAAVGTADVRLLPAGVGADDAEPAAGGELLVADTRGDDHHVAGIQGEGDALLAPELRHRRSAVDAEHLVGRTVVVMEGEDAVAPAAHPVVAAEELLEHRSRVALGEIHGTRIDQQRQPWVVGDLPVRLQQVRNDLRAARCGVDFGRHGPSIPPSHSEPLRAARGV